MTETRILDDRHEHKHDSHPYWHLAGRIHMSRKANHSDDRPYEIIPDEDVEKLLKEA